VFHSDKEFITDLFNARPFMKDRPIESNGTDLCNRCSNTVHQLLIDFVTSVDELQKSSVQCELCRLLLKVIVERLSTETTTEPLSIQRKGSKITVQRGSHNCRLVTIRRFPGSETHQCTSSDDIEMGMPSLCRIDDPEYSQLLLAWLRDCDAKHTECRKDFDPSGAKARQYPARLLFIDKSIVRLIDTEYIDDSGAEPFRYLALSYTWGDKAVHKRYFTTTDTYKQHCTAIPRQSLPNLFVDALTITQNLEIKYLWIDALCIVQGEGGDWETEAERMHATFSAAYCVLAASHCAGTSDRILVERPRQPLINFRDNGLAFSEDIDDFQLEVIEGAMNKRGWVLQERALARRTIYFAEKQTYWECGQGVRCETLTKMTNKIASFLGDANFPQVAHQDSYGARIRLLQDLYQRYSRLGFSVSTDRPVAIAGLETRLINAFETSGGFGLFERYLGRSLLWIRAPEAARLTKIQFGPAQRNPVPSWSWMAYEGAISFLDLPFGQVDWTVDVEFRSPDYSTSGNTPWGSCGRMSSNRNGHLTKFRAVARPFDMAVAAAAAHASHFLSGIVWDDPTAPHDPGRQLRCVVIGRLRSESDLPTQQHWVLVVRELGAGLYERVGAGSLPKHNISQGAQEMNASVC